MTKTLILALGIALLGCGKKADDKKADDKKADDTTKPADKPTDKPADKPDMAKPADKPADPATADKPADKPAEGGATFASDDEYLAKGKEAMGKLIDIFKADGKDCEKIAGDVTKLLQEPVFTQSKAYEKAHPDIKKKFGDATKDLEKQFEKEATPALTACAKNKAFTDAFAKME
jgi:hypothetical protein